MRDNKGRFIKGFSSSPQTQFKKGQPSPRRGVSKPGWKNQTSWKKGHVPWMKGKVRPEISNENHHNWAGDSVQYGALHSWIYRKLGEPKYCEFCKRIDKKNYHWANKSGDYKREFEDWMRLCVSCHKIYDLERKRVSQITETIISCFKGGGRLLIMGNGGSASMAQHMAAEFMGKFEKERDALPAIALTTDTSFLTAWSNDKEYETIFSRQIEALGSSGDVVIGISTSGLSKNVIIGLARAQERGLTTIDFPRTNGPTAKVQEYQLKLMHDIVREVEEYFS